MVGVSAARARVNARHRRTLSRVFASGALVRIEIRWEGRRLRRVHVRKAPLVERRNDSSFDNGLQCSVVRRSDGGRGGGAGERVVSVRG